MSSKRVRQFIERIRAYIIHLHIHDVRANDIQDHLPVGQDQKTALKKSVVRLEQPMETVGKSN